MTQLDKNCTYHEKEEARHSGLRWRDAEHWLSRMSSRTQTAAASLQPGHDPASPDTAACMREAIPEDFLHQKKEMPADEGLQKQRAPGGRSTKSRSAGPGAAMVSRALQPFTPRTSWGTRPDAAQPGPSAGPAGNGKAKDKKKMLPSFWVPSLTPEAKPLSGRSRGARGKPLRMSRLRGPGELI